MYLSNIKREMNIRSKNYGTEQSFKKQNLFKQ